MPANLPPDYKAAEQRFREAKTVEDKIAAIQEMMAIIPKHKGTDKLRADLRRRLPSVDQLLQAEGAAALVTRYGRSLVVDQIRCLLDGARVRAAAGDEPGLREALGSLVGQLRERLRLATEPSLIPLINATGVVIHTNLGRAPLSPAAARRVSELAASYSNLELDLAGGERGNREIHAEARLRTIWGPRPRQWSTTTRPRSS